MQKFWQAVSPILRQHPLDRELYIGWDLIGGELQATEITEGKQLAEIRAENEKLVREGKAHLTSSALGSIRHLPHLLSFHTHVLDPRLILPQNRDEQISLATPRSSYNDLSSLVLFPQEYGEVVLDISLQGQMSIGRIMLAFETTNSWQIDETIYEELSHKLIREMYFSDALDFHQHATNTVQLPSRKINPGTLAMIKKIQSDEHWCKFTGVTIYRGLLSANPDINSIALRWDLFYQELMGLRGKRRERFWSLRKLLNSLYPSLPSESREKQGIYKLSRELNSEISDLALNYKTDSNRSHVG